MFLHWESADNRVPPAVEGMEKEVPYFFLSYARESGNPEVMHFYNDLCQQLVQYDTTGRSAEEQCFVDTSSIPLGQTWPESLIDALSTCKVMLALCTGPYFGSEPCGKEFQVFLERMQTYQTPGGTRPALLLPIMWVPLREREIPAAVSNLQFHTDRLGEVYRKYGLRQLIRVKEYEGAYHTFVFELASIIREVADQHDLPDQTSRPAFHEVSSAFQRTTILPPTGHHGAGSRRTRAVDVTGRSDVHFVIAAPSKQEIEGIREELQFYGDWSTDWAPYKPNHAVALGTYARQVASTQQLTSEASTVADLQGQVARARDTNQIVVLLVDSWAVRLDKYERVLTKCENEHADHTAVMIPASATDEETSAHLGELMDKVQQVFRDRNRADDTYWPGVRTRHTFAGDLAELLELAKNHLISNGPIFRQPPGDDDGDIPTLDGP